MAYSDSSHCAHFDVARSDSLGIKWQPEKEAIEENGYKYAPWQGPI